MYTNYKYQNKELICSKSKMVGGQSHVLVFTRLYANRKTLLFAPRHTVYGVNNRRCTTIQCVISTYYH